MQGKDLKIGRRTQSSLLWNAGGVTMHRQRSRLLGSGILLLLAGTLVLAACNSDSVSGSQPNTSKTTNAEGKSAASPSGSRPKGLIEAAIANTR
jgi:hypothetical protein